MRFSCVFVVLCLAVLASSRRVEDFKQSCTHNEPLVRPSRAQKRVVSRSAILKLSGETAARIPYNAKATVAVVGAEDADVDDVEVAMPGKAFQKTGRIPPGQARRLQQREKVGRGRVTTRVLEFKGRSSQHHGFARFRAPADGKKRVVVVKDDNPVQLVVESNLDDYIEGTEFSFRCALTSNPDGQPDGVITSGSVTFKHSSDAEGVEVDLVDNGDGWYTASGVVARAGSYSVDASVEGTDTAGEEVQRTASTSVSVAPNAFDGITAVSMRQDPDSPDIIVSLHMSGPATSGTFIVYIELHGTNEAGADAEVAILSGQSELDGDKLEFFMPREELHGFTGGYRASTARVQCPETNNVHASIDNAAVTTSITALSREPHPMQEEETPEEHAIRRTMGRKPKREARMETQQYGTTHGILLSHGYCAGSNPWPSSHFTGNKEFFLNANQGVSHSTFCNNLRNFGDQKFRGYGVIAHSQGGCAALHCYTYWWTGMDYTTSGNRKIQSVGTPYQGTALASLAGIGNFFGFGCPLVNDLEYSGASSWLAGIPTWARSEVTYYTTSFNDRWWAYDYCHLLSDVILSDPDDGTTEKAKGQLSSANNGGHKEGWCHTDSMRDPAQYVDSSRNSNMNANAER